MSFWRVHGVCDSVAEGLCLPDIVRLSRSVLLVSLLGAFCGLALGTGGANAAEWGSAGEGAGQLSKPRGVAVEEMTDRVYVADQQNNRVDEFEANGTFVRAWGWGVDSGNEKLEVCTTTCKSGKMSSGAGGFDEPDGIAIDPTSKDLYVVDQGNHRVEEMTASGEFVLMLGGDVNKTTGKNVCSATNLTESDECQTGRSGSESGEFEDLGEQGAVAVSSSGLVYVGDLRRVQWFSSTGTVEGSFSVVAEKQVEALVVTSGGKICLTVNPNLFVTQNSPAPEVRCYNLTGTLETTIDLEEKQLSGTTAFVWLAADDSGHLFVDQYLKQNSEDVTSQAIVEYGEEGKELAVSAPLGGDPTKEPGGLGVTESGGAANGIVQAFIAEDKVRSSPLPPAGPIILEESAEPATAGCLKLIAVINPEGAQTRYKFAYGIEALPGETTGEAVMPSENFKLEKVSITQCGLVPESTYNYFAIAENAAGGPIDGQEQSIVTAPALKIDGLWSTEVSEAGASLEAEISPAGVESEYRFEYAPAGGTYAAAGSGDLGAGIGDVRVATRISGLAAHTTYVYRLVAHNSVGTSEQEDEFVTRRAGAPPALLDDRVWEQVSPPQKHGAAIELKLAEGLVRATPAGDKITYYAATTSESNPAGEPVPTPQQIVSSHEMTGGWKSKSIVTPNTQHPELKTKWVPEYWLFSSNLQRSVVVPNPFTALSQWTVGQERTPYVRDESQCPTATVSLVQLQESECFTPLLTDIGPFADVSKAVEYGGSPTLALGLVNAVATTPDLSHVVLKSRGPELQQGAAEQAIYDWNEGSLTPISLTSAGATCNAILGAPGGFSELGSDSRNALAPSGSLAVWSGESGECTGHLYVRDIDKAVTAQVDEVQGGTGLGAPDAIYQDASVGDQHVFFTDSQRLMAGSTGTQNGVGGATTNSADLYEYAFDPTSDTGNIVDMTVPTHTGEAAGVQGVLGVAENGSLVYAVASGVLTKEVNTEGAAAQPGEDNLYLLENVGGTWRAKFIATLSKEDGNDWNEEVGQATARVSPNGRWLAFMSNRSLTGYDNRDRFSGAADEEVFLFDASAARLICASCNPTGARPAGMELHGLQLGVAPLIDSEFEWQEGQWLSGALPVRYGIGLSGTISVYQPRYLSDGGRLFFNSAEALVPQDTNGTVDVYEYEPIANGEVAASDSCSETSPTFSASAGGCIDLVSGGSGSNESVFVDASENGDDVFFETAARLAGSDIDTAYDVYDAHVCGVGASWACASPPAESVLSCELASTCKASMPPGGAAGVLASEALEGLGNLAASAKNEKQPMSTQCPRGTRRHGDGCVKAKAKSKRKRRRRRAHARKAGRTRTRGGR